MGGELGACWLGEDEKEAAFCREMWDCHYDFLFEVCWGGHLLGPYYAARQEGGCCSSGAMWRQWWAASDGGVDACLLWHAWAGKPPPQDRICTVHFPFSRPIPPPPLLNQG